MISNERPSPYRDRTFTSHPAKAHMEETTLQEAQLQIERKTFVFNLRENSRGRFLRITEGGTGKRNTVIIPASGLDEFSRVFSAMARSEGELAENGPGNEG